MAIKYVWNPFTNNLDSTVVTTGFVPYTGATGNVDLGAYSLSAGTTYTSRIGSSVDHYCGAFEDPTGNIVLICDDTYAIDAAGNVRVVGTLTATTYGPMSAAGDLLVGGALGVATRLAIGGANTVLHGGASVPSYSAVVESNITLTPGNTTNNTIVGTHGFAPALDGLTTHFLRGDGAWGTPASVTVPYGYISESFAYLANTAHNIVHNFGTYPVVQAFDTSGYMIIPETIQNTDLNTVAITFNLAGTYTLILTCGSPPLTNYTSTSGNYAMLASDYLIEETGASKIVTLLTPVGRSGKTVIIKNSSVGVCDVQTAAGLIDGVADVTLASMDSLTVCSNNTNWMVI